jgi:hypothetical protein
MFRKYVWFLLATCVAGALSVSAAASAEADAPAPGWEVTGDTFPTHLSPGGQGRIRLYVYDTGAVGASGTLTATLPEGLTAVDEPGCTGLKVVTCEVSALEGAIGEAAGVGIPVEVAQDASGKAFVGVTVEGGGAVHPARTSIPIEFNSAPAGVGFSSFDGWFSNADGTIDTQAGSHPYALTLAFTINSIVENGTGLMMPAGGETRNITINLPPGVVGDPDAVPQCTRAEFDNEANNGGEAKGGCPVASQIGWDWAAIPGAGSGFVLAFAVYNLVPPPGVAAQFGFTITGNKALLDAKVRSGGDSGISESVENITERHITYNSTTIWGVPGSPIYDPARSECVYGARTECPSTGGAKPFLTLPTYCAGPQKFTAEILGTYEDANAFAEASFVTHNTEDVPTGFTGCEHLVHFEPTISIAPDTSQADTPAGLTATVKVPQGVNPELGTSGLRNTTVVLPEGMAINPGQATGLQACQTGDGPGDDDLPREGEDGETEAFEGPPQCPSASKVGEDEISTPLLPDRLKGSVYVLQSNPPEVKLLVAASGDGVNLKLIGTVRLDTSTGRITTTFENTPDAPLNEFRLSFSGGAQAALVTPPTCRVYTTSADFSPWSAPSVSDAFLEGSFVIDSGPDGTPCANPLPFAPEMTAGATTDQAGGYTDFTMLLTRGDGQQRISSLQFKTPEGLLGMIANVSLCGEPQAGRGECTAASQIGHTVTTAGPGPYPFQVPQAGGPPAPIYLTGPYQGAPYGLSIVVPVIAGPFNLGTVVVRARIEVDPHTSQLTITTGELPRILDGVPTDLRAIDAVIDRPNFMFNPTDCEPMSFAGTATSTEGTTAAISSHFQVGSCQALKFQPDFKVSTSGKTSKIDGASLDAKIVYPAGNLGDNQASAQSNIKTVKVELPKKLPSRLTTLQKACTAGTFEANPANCPSASLVGHATAVTPVLPVPLNGPVYFVSHGGEAFPSLIVVLQGDGVTVDLVGTTFISNTSITSSTFKQVPDVPIASFELVLPEGRYSALAANGNLCKTKLTMPTAFTAQNGAVINQSTKINVTGCAKTKKATKRPTRAQKLTKALKSCGKEHSKEKRSACEKQARKKYGPAKGKKRKK